MARYHGLADWRMRSYAPCEQLLSRSRPLVDEWHARWDSAELLELADPQVSDSVQLRLRCVRTHARALGARAVPSQCTSRQ